MKLSLSRAFTCFIALMIAYGTLTPPGGYNLTTGPASFFDKHQHAISFALLVLPLTWVNFRSALWLVPLALLYGGMIELLQPLIGRSNSWSDIAANAAGIGIGILPGAFRTQIRRSRAK